MKKIIFSIALALFSMKMCFSQQVLSIDTSEVYIFAYFDYSGNKDSCFHNNFKIMILENEINIQKNLHCGSTSYQYIPFSEKETLANINNIVNNHFRANLVFETSYSYMEAWLSFLDSQPDYHSPQFENILSIYNDTTTKIMIFQNGPDILGEKISKELEGYKFTDSCTFYRPGIYYILYKVKMSYVIFDDQKNIFVNTITKHVSSPFITKREDSVMSICPDVKNRRICTWLIPLTKQGSIPVALPYKVELLEPYEK